MDRPVSIAIETSCRQGSVALGAGSSLVAEIAFDAASRHAAQLVTRLDDMLRAHGLRPGDVNEVYVSVGPGSFTGTRVAVTVARMLAHTAAGLRTVAVPTAAAVAEGAAGMDWQRLGVIFDAREGLIYAATFVRGENCPLPAEPQGVMLPSEYLDLAGEPLKLVGEGLAYHSFPQELILAPEALDARPHLPSAANVWRVGRRLAEAGQFTDYHLLDPIYCRKPEAVRAWERKHGREMPNVLPADKAGDD